jgi:hypothetical protein
MPKYQNISKEVIFLYKDNKTLLPGHTIETIYFYPDLETQNKLKLLDIHPYVSPITKSDIVTLDSNNNPKFTLNLYENELANYTSSISNVSVKLLDVTGADYILLKLNNDVEENIEIKYGTFLVYATNTLKLLPNREFTFKNNRMIKTITFELPSGGQSAKIYYEITNTLSDFFF